MSASYPVQIEGSLGPKYWIFEHSVQSITFDLTFEVDLIKSVDLARQLTSLPFEQPVI